MAINVSRGESGSPSAREFFFGPDWFSVEQARISDHVMSIHETHHAECDLAYYVHSGENAVLIDTGLGLADIRRVLPNPDIPVLLTHGHWDHMGGASVFNDVAIHPVELARAQWGWLPQEMVGVGSLDPDMNIPESFSPANYTIPGVPEAKTIEDGETIKVGNLTLQAIHTPGHTPGSLCFFIEETGELFTGDTVMAGREHLHLLESSIQDYAKSVQKLSLLTGNKLRRLYPGHGHPDLPKFYPASLLHNHVRALRGGIQPEAIRAGYDDYGPYKEVDFSPLGFTFKIKPEDLR